MGRKSEGTARSEGWLKRGFAAGIAAVMSVGIAIPAIADELTDWGYDSQTRSLILVLPDSATPSVLVVTPTQLAIELPDTQLGVVAELAVNDGVVESIMLEQVTPDTVRMVVEFAPGTVLADSQSATLVATADALSPGSQQWRVRPALLASSRQMAEDAPVGSAESLNSSNQLAQTPDLPDLPVLEPAMPTDELVSVPPLETAPPLPPPDSLASMPAAAPPPPPPIEVARPSVEPVPVDTAPPVADSGDAVIAPAPAVDPPFIGEVGMTEPPANLSAEPPIVDSLFEEGATAVLGETVTAGEDAIEAEEMVEPEAPVEVAEVAETPPAPTLIEAETAAEPPVEVPSAAPVVDVPAETVSPANVSRWPEPIPFGQPLP